MKELKETLNELKEKVNNEEPKDQIVPDWEGMYEGLLQNYEKLQKENEELKNVINSYQQYIQQLELTIRVLTSLMNK